MTTRNCRHRMAWNEPIADDVWVGRGLVCAKCGFQTFTSETYFVVEKDCPDCGQRFLGMADVGPEPCGKCCTQRTEEWIARIKLCPHPNLVRGHCRTCGTGIHGPHQWRWRLLHRIGDMRYHLNGRLFNTKGERK